MERGRGSAAVLMFGRIYALGCDTEKWSVTIARTTLMP